ncbi:hypothetical protein [Phenylobacterium sp.]|uniref:hypothetical protein n=1 Tax=Phenylobacterium sp. TaxID=1871053 RepID=UPI003562F95A
MSLLERSASFVSDTTELGALRSSAHQVQAVETRTGQLEAALAKLRLALGRRTLLVSEGLTVALDTKSAGGIAFYLRTFKADLASDPAAAASNELSPKTIGPLNLLSAAVEAASAAAWSAHVRSKVPSVGEDLLQHLSQISALQARVERVRRLRRDALALADQLPIDPAIFKTLDDLAEACATAWRTLDAESLPPSVARFLRDASSDGGADLARLDEPVQTWLTANGLGGAFGIRTR